VINGLIGDFVPAQRFDEEWDVAGLQQVLKSEFGVEFDLVGLLDSDETMNEEKLSSYIAGKIDRQYDKKVDEIGEPIMRQFEKVVMLTQLDTHWKGHLAALDYLRQGIHLRGYAQKNPKQEYKREAFEMFGMMLDQVKREVVGILSRAELRTEEDVESVEAQRRSDQNLQTRHAPADSVLIGPAANPDNLAGPPTPFVRPERKVGRNEPCPCGSGKKYKQCHGRIE
jgi:preprotein translocase subunit SecA